MEGKSGQEKQRQPQGEREDEEETDKNAARPKCVSNPGEHVHVAQLHDQTGMWFWV